MRDIRISEKVINEDNVYYPEDIIISKIELGIIKVILDWIRDLRIDGTLQISKKENPKGKNKEVSVVRMIRDNYFI